MFLAFGAWLTMLELNVSLVLIEVRVFSTALIAEIILVVRHPRLNILLCFRLII